MDKYRKLPPNYFILANPIIIFLVVVGMYLITMAWLNPDKISTSIFGPLGHLAIMLGKDFPNLTRQVALGAYAIHLGEAAVCLYICHQLKLSTPTTIAWFLQTIGLGMIGLRFLIWPIGELNTNKNKKEDDVDKSKDPYEFLWAGCPTGT